jgi:hypothetical protein
MAAKKFFIRQTSIEKLLQQVDVLEKKIDILSQRSGSVETSVDHGRTAVYSQPVMLESVVVPTSAIEVEDAPMYIPKARMGQAAIKKVKTTLGSHDSDNVEKLKRKRSKKEA